MSLKSAVVRRIEAQRAARSLPQAGLALAGSGDGRQDARPARREPAFDASAFAPAPAPRPAPAPPAPAPAFAPAPNPVVHDEDEDEILAFADPPMQPASAPIATIEPAPSRVGPPPAAAKPGKRMVQETHAPPRREGDYQLPPLGLLTEPKKSSGAAVSTEALEQNATLLETTLEDFGVRGEIINVRPGPVVTLYELEPAPGTKSSRVISLADDIARSMSAVSARVAVRARAATPSASNCPTPSARPSTCANCSRREDFESTEAQARAVPRQDHRRRAGHRRSRPHAASAGRRHHRLGQVGGDQHHDPVAALPAQAGGVPPHHGRPQDAGAVRLRRHPAPALARRDRPQEGGRSR